VEELRPSKVLPNLTRLQSAAIENIGTKTKKVPKNAAEAYKFAIEEFFEDWDEHIVFE
jgi:hypothetical protein